MNCFKTALHYTNIKTPMSYINHHPFSLKHFLYCAVPFGKNFPAIHLFCLNVSIHLFI